MKKLFLVGMFLFVISTYTNSYSETLTIAKVEGNIHQELGAQLLEEIYKRVNVSIEFIELPGQRALELSSAGEVDGEVIRIAKIGTMYPSLIRIPTAYSYAENVVFSKNHNLNVSGWASLKNYKVGIARGMKHYEIQLEGTRRVEKINDNSILIQMLDLDRVDVVVTTRLNGLYQKNRMGNDSIKALSPPLDRMPTYHYLHEKHRDLVPKVDQVIKTMIKSGELEKLREKIIEKLMEQS